MQENILSYNSQIVGYCGCQEVPWVALSTVAQQTFFRQQLLGETTSGDFTDINLPRVAVEMEIVRVTQWRERWTRGNEAAVPRAFSLENLIFDTWTFRASDPRDMIFGLHGILTQKTPQDWLPNYTKSTGQVFAEATKQIMREAGSLRMLSAVHDQSLRNVTDLPSWVPDYSAGYCNMACASFHAAGQLPFHPVFDSAPWNVLTISGAQRIDTVLSTGNTTSGPNQLIRYFDQSWLELALLLPHPYHTGQSRTDALWRTLLVDRSVEGTSPAPSSYGVTFRGVLAVAINIIAAGTAREAASTPNPPPELIDLVSAFHHVEQTWSNPPMTDFSPSDLQHNVCDPVKNLSGSDCQSLTHLLHKLKFLAIVEEDPYTPTIEDVMVVYFGPNKGLWVPWDECMDMESPFHIYMDDCYIECRNRLGRRRPFVTGKRYLGLGPASAKADDEVWAIPGAGAAFVLRKTGEERRYHLVGECYVHGVMDGEAVTAEPGEVTHLV